MGHVQVGLKEINVVLGKTGIVNHQIQYVHVIPTARNWEIAAQTTMTRVDTWWPMDRRSVKAKEMAE